MRLWVLVAAATVLCGCAAAASVTFELGDWLTFAAAIPAGIGGVTLGDRGAAWLIERGYVRGKR